MEKGISSARNFALWGLLAIALGLSPMMVLVLVASCFDECVGAPRFGAYFSIIFLLPGIALSGIAWFMSVQQSIRHLRPMNYFAAYVLPSTIVLLFGILTSSVGGNALFPRTYSEHDSWIYVWFAMIF